MTVKYVNKCQIDYQNKEINIQKDEQTEKYEGKKIRFPYLSITLLL